MLSDHELLEILKEKILNKCEITKITGEGCKRISQMIFEQDKNYLSETTIKRLYGLIEWHITFPPFVLNSLCLFTFSKNYQDFRKSYRDSVLKE